MRRAATFAGFIRGEKGNITDALRGLSQGDFRLTRVSDRNIDPDVEQSINTCILDRQAFTLTVTKEGSDRIETIAVSHAKISMDVFGNYSLLVHSSQENINELPRLKLNHTIEFSRIVFIEIAPHKLWSEDLSRLTVEFWLSGTRTYEQHPDDISLRPGIYKRRAGKKITREIFSSKTFLHEVIAYNSDCYLLSPLPLQFMLRTKLGKVLDCYTGLDVLDD